MKKLLNIFFALILTCVAQAQMVEPVHFSSELKMLGENEAEILFNARIDAGWHVYSTELGDGPISATFNVVKLDGVETVGKLMARGGEIKHFDKMFGMELRYFEQKVTFVQRIRFTKQKYVIDCYLEYGACNDEMCLPPSEVIFKESKSLPQNKEKDDITVAKTNTDKTGTAEDIAMTDTAAVDTMAVDTAGISALPVEWGGDNLEDFNGDYLYIFFMGLVGGLLAVCMPCIWPIIPMTVSFFLKRAKDDRLKGLRDALTYGLSIIVIYLGLGLLVTAFFGSDALNAMSTNAVFNVFLFLLLVIFALSFFGWFEMRLPDSWANAVDTKAAATGGLVSIFLMAFTLVLVSFSCTAPIVGLLLVETATSGNWSAPAIGMLGFALALALPFTLFALFPSWLKQTPKSGSWMNTLKVVLGFIELAFSLKFLSVADLAYGWHILDREVFLSLWIVIFFLLGAYLCGWLKFQSDVNDQQPSNGGQHPVFVMGGLVSLAFALYMVPGLWGAPCKAVSAFAPPMSTQDFNLNTKVVEARYKDYEQGMEAARREGKPVIVDFTGFGCVNCRKMEAVVWTDPRVADKLMNDYVLISLYVDDKTPLPAPVEVTDRQGNKKTLRTVGAKWSWLQSQRFGANAQPFYVLLDNNGRPLTGSRAYDEDIQGYLDFLDQGLRRYKR
jgi:thiol:disulfide interchange protein DsbD